MKKSNFGSIASVETMGLVDGPGIRFVIFFNGCNKRCKYCHNPEMWNMQEKNSTVNELVNKVLRYKEYFKDNGGVTLSGGEALMQEDFTLELCQELKKHDVSIALDTAGFISPKTPLILSFVDYILLDIKHIENKAYFDLTGVDIKMFNDFLNLVNKSGKKVWIRQVIVPDFNDNDEYLLKLKQYIKNINNIERIDFLPYHNLAKDKYKKLGIEYVYKDKQNMSLELCNDLLNKFKKL